MRRLCLTATLILGSILGPTLGLAGCTEAGPDGSSEIDTRLATHALLPGQPTAEGLAYVEAVADAHRRADRTSDREAAVDILLAALELAPPTDDGAAERLHYQLLARAGEELLALGDSERALNLLAPRLNPERSLPIDRAAARALVALGDAAAATRDQALAMGSYTRALEMLTLLLEEVES